MDKGLEEQCDDEKAAEEYVAELESQQPGCYNQSYGVGALETAFLAGIQYGRENPGWISVSKQLPPHSDSETKLYLVWVVSERGSHAETSMLYPDGKWSHLRSEEIVTHWMPLPKNPDGVEK